MVYIGVGISTCGRGIIDITIGHVTSLYVIVCIACGGNTVVVIDIDTVIIICTDTGTDIFVGVDRCTGADIIIVIGVYAVTCAGIDIVVGVGRSAGADIIIVIGVYAVTCAGIDIIVVVSHRATHYITIGIV